MTIEMGKETFTGASGIIKVEIKKEGVSDEYVSVRVFTENGTAEG